MRDSDSLESEGENLQAVWSPDGKLIAILVSVSIGFARDYLFDGRSRCCAFVFGMRNTLLYPTLKLTDQYLGDKKNFIRSNR